MGTYAEYMLRSIGADHVIDYTQEDFTKSGQTYEVFFDTVGKSSFSGSIRSLKENGTYLNANPGLLGRVRMRWTSKRSSKRIIPWTAGYTANNLLALKELIVLERLKRSSIGAIRWYRLPRPIGMSIQDKKREMSS